MKAIELERSAFIQAPPEKVFELLADSENWITWAAIASVEIERQSGPDGTGEIRQFRIGPLQLREEIVVCEPTQRYSYILHSGLPINDYRVDIDLTAEFGGCTLRWKTTFSPKVRGTGRILTGVIGGSTGKLVRGLSAEAESRAMASRS